MSLENSPNSSAEFGELSKLRFKRIFFLSLEISPNSRVEFGDFLQTQGLSLEIFRFKISKLIFFRKKQNLKNTHTQRLSLENSPNSRVEFGDLANSDSKETNPENMFFSKTTMSLENSPTSSAEFGEFSKLRFKRIFSEFGEFSKLKG